MSDDSRRLREALSEAPAWLVRRVKDAFGPNRLSRQDVLAAVERAEPGSKVITGDGMVVLAERGETGWHRHRMPEVPMDAAFVAALIAQGRGQLVEYNALKCLVPLCREIGWLTMTVGHWTEDDGVPRWPAGSPLEGHEIPRPGTELKLCSAHVRQMEDAYHRAQGGLR